MKQPIKERLELVKRKEYSEDSFLEHRNTDNVNFNAGVDACLPLLEEVMTTAEDFMNEVDYHNFLEALTPPTK